jgi:hypothetical protein
MAPGSTTRRLAKETTMGFFRLGKYRMVKVGEM